MLQCQHVIQPLVLELEVVTAVELYHLHLEEEEHEGQHYRGYSAPIPAGAMVVDDGRGVNCECSA